MLLSDVLKKNNYLAIAIAVKEWHAAILYLKQ